MQNLYVLFVKTGFENTIVDLIKRTLNADKYKPFIFTKDKYFRNSHKDVTENTICFPGYVFIESDEGVIEFIANISNIKRKISGIYRVLNYGDKFDIIMLENERSILMSLYGFDYNLKASIGLMEGDKIRITSGALVGKESLIKKINRHKRMAIIEIQFMGNLCKISVALNCIEKI